MEPVKEGLLQPLQLWQIAQQAVLKAKANESKIGLTADALSLILAKLPLTDLAKARKVCKQFQTAAQKDPTIVKALTDAKTISIAFSFLYLKPSDLNKITPQELAKLAGLVEQLQFKDFIQVTDNPPKIKVLKQPNTDTIHPYVDSLGKRLRQFLVSTKLVTDLERFEPLHTIESNPRKLTDLMRLKLLLSPSIFGGKTNYNTILKLVVVSFAARYFLPDNSYFIDPIMHHTFVKRGGKYNQFTPDDAKKNVLPNAKSLKKYDLILEQ